jgi:hypothetical protein
MPFVTQLWVAKVREKVKTQEKQEGEYNIDSFYEPEYYHQT